MEVDEAASHIKELVDPDANIIWGSAFNNDLGGKIRVSVVATGIEAEAGVQPAPAKVFSFPSRASAAAANAAPAQPPAPASEELADDAASDADEQGGEELLLGADDVLTSPVGAPPIAPPSDEDDAEQPAANAGGTLFERMSNIARGAPKVQGDEPAADYRREPIDIPRFLNRQNNQ
jgi:cell division protein FtsZ